MTRLIRETNPSPGFRAGVLPQHELLDGSFAKTGENNPLPIAEYGMTENGVWVPRKVTEDGHGLTQLTGSYVEEILPREIRDENVYKEIRIPFKARGFSIFATINGVTGTFEEGQGMGIRLFFITRETYSVVRTVYQMLTQRVTSGGGNILVHFSPDGVDENILHSRVLERLLTKSALPTPYMRVDLMIDGDFAEGEGFDCEMRIMWQY